MHFLWIIASLKACMERFSSDYADSEYAGQLFGYIVTLLHDGVGFCAVFSICAAIGTVTT